MKFKTSKNIFAHIDCDSFFANCEVLNNPGLRNKYVCVGSEIIIAATYNAKALGIKIGMPIWEAKKILRNKDAFYTGVNMQIYVKISRKLMAYLEEHTLDVRKFSIDEAFVEISGLAEMNGQHLEEYLKKIQQDILKHIGIPVSIGVSNTRLKAKIFSKVRKPFGICIGIDTQQEKALFQSLSFQEIPYIGTKTAKKLEFQISSIQDFIGLGYRDIVSRFGKNGGRIWLELRGISSMRFLPKVIAKSMGRARGFNREMTSEQTVLLKWIYSNLERMCDELYYKGHEIGEISLLLIDENWTHYKARVELQGFTSDRTEIFRVLKQLFGEIYIFGKVYRKTGVGSCQIRSTKLKQLSIFDGENMKSIQNLNIEKLLSDVEGKYGKGVLRVGV